MGCGSSKVNDLPLPYLLHQLRDCEIPEESNKALDFIDRIDNILAEVKEKDYNMKQLKKSNGMQILIRQVKKLVDGKVC